MITQLTAEQAIQRWDYVEYAILQALPPTARKSPDLTTNLLKSVMDGTLLVWVVWRSAEQGTKVVAVCTTAEVGDVAGTKDLLIYSLFGQMLIDDEEYRDAIEQLSKWAVHRGCKALTAYTQSATIIKKLIDRGWVTDWVYATFTLNGGV